MLSHEVTTQSLKPAVSILPEDSIHVVLTPEAEDHRSVEPIVVQFSGSGHLLAQDGRVQEEFALDLRDLEGLQEAPKPEFPVEEWKRAVEESPEKAMEITAAFQLEYQVQLDDWERTQKGGLGARLAEKIVSWVEAQGHKVNKDRILVKTPMRREDLPTAWVVTLFPYLG